MNIDKLKYVRSSCFCSYAGGKDYGDYWSELKIPNLPVKGLCEFCNLNSMWYNKTTTS